MNKDKFNKIIFIVTIVSLVLTAMIIGFNYLLPIYLSKVVADESKSIAIIGGADGPTAIFISSSTNSNIYVYVFIFIAIAGSIYLLLQKRKFR